MPWGLLSVRLFGHQPTATDIAFVATPLSDYCEICAPLLTLETIAYSVRLPQIGKLSRERRSAVPTTKVPAALHRSR